MDCSPPGSSIHGIFQARVLEWGAIAFSWHFIKKQNRNEQSFLDSCWHSLSSNGPPWGAACNSGQWVSFPPASKLLQEHKQLSLFHKCRDWGEGKLSFLSKETWILVSLPHPKARPFMALCLPHPNYFGLCFQIHSFFLNLIFLLRPSIQNSEKKCNFQPPDKGIKKQRLAKVEVNTTAQRTSVIPKYWSVICA